MLHAAHVAKHPDGHTHEQGSMGSPQDLLHRPPSGVVLTSFH